MPFSNLIITVGLPRSREDSFTKHQLDFETSDAPLRKQDGLSTHFQVTRLLLLAYGNFTEEGKF